MSEQEQIKQRVLKLRVRKRAQVIADYAVRGLFWGALPAALAVFATKLWIIPARLWIVPIDQYLVGAALLAVITLGFAIRGMLKRITPLGVANDIDVTLGLRERVSSALALGEPVVVGARLVSPTRNASIGKSRMSKSSPLPSDPFVRALVHDAAKAVDKLPLRKVYPWRMPRAWRLALPALLIAAALTFVPQLNWLVSQSDRANAKLIQDQGHSLKELAEQMKKEAEQKKDPVLKEQAEEIKRVGEKLDSGAMKKKDALKELQRLKDKLEAQSKPPAGERKLLEQLGKELEGKTSTRELGEMLKQGDMQGLSEQLKELAQDAAKGTLSAEQQQSLKDLMQALDEALKSEAANNPEAKELKEHLEKLKQAIEQQQKLQQQMQQTMQNFSQAVNNLTQQMSSNNMNQQAQQLSQTLQQMQQQAAQQGSVGQQTLQQMQQQLQSAQQQIQQNQNLSQSQQQQMNQQAQQALEYLQQQDGQPGQLSQQNQQAQQGQQEMQQQAQKTSDCVGGT